jgi:hypothetical protein
MITQPARFYIHDNSVGDLSKCMQVYDQYATQITTLFENQKVMGYQFLIVEDQEEAEDELIWCDYETVTTNKFPFVCSVIQPNGAEDLDGMMTTWDFRRCAAL